MLRITTITLFINLLVLAGCDGSDRDLGPDGKDTCGLTGVACIADCPASGKLAGGAPCQRGTWLETECRCDPITTAQTCAEAGGTCGAFSAGGVLCDAGYSLAADAGTCPGVGGACCLPNGKQCPPSGAACRLDCPASGQLGGAPCVYGKWIEAECRCAQPTCAEVGGKCGALHGGGVTCDAGYSFVADAGSCAGVGVGSACCLPDTAPTCPPTGLVCTLECPVGGGKLASGAPCAYGKWIEAECRCAQPTCKEAGGKCGSLGAGAVQCDSGYHVVAGAGTCSGVGVGSACCLPR